MLIRAKDYLRIRYNRSIHDEQSRDYQTSHVEIYNPTEQSRIRAMVTDACAKLGRVRALDFGAGTGNLTRHLLAAGAEVVAADVSGDSLRELRRQLPDAAALSTVELDGKALGSFANGSFDLVITYSVLHHVPEYLAIVREFGRVVRPGGLVVIDHECCPSYWDQSAVYREYMAAYQKRYGVSRATLWRNRLAKGTSLAQWRRFLAQRLLRVNAEGDIHVYPDDHIEWDLVRTALASCDVESETDYLVCREREPVAALHAMYRTRCSDMRVGVYRRR